LGAPPGGGGLSFFCPAPPRHAYAPSGPTGATSPAKAVEDEERLV
jgi:hypothetical protein